VFECFDGNYVWNLSVLIALASGGSLDEIDRACRSLHEAAGDTSDAATAAFLREWSRVADQLVALAEEDQARGRVLSAGQKYGRTATYLGIAERMQRPDAPFRAAVYERMLDLFWRSVELQGEPTQRVEVPYGYSALPAYLMTPPTDGPTPCMIQWNGLDSTKEMLYQSRLADELARRGIATLMVDTPGKLPVPHYWDHVLWVWGKEDVDELMAVAPQITLDGVVEHIDVPFLILHGENDRQIPLGDAHRSYEQAVRSPKRELKIFPSAIGATEHVGVDNLPLTTSYIADWIAETFAERSAVSTDGARPSTAGIAR
jgi:pimeloyl-ACP methyl ester carboxylesterase